jgi:HEAT repeat protein
VEVEMKLTTKAITVKILLLTAFLLMPAAGISAQDVKKHDLKLKPNAIANLVEGINSQNEGVRRSAVYLAGKYEIRETVDALITLLKKEKNPSIRILIALALYKIGNEKGVDAIYNYASFENDPRVKRIYDAIVYEYEKNKNIYASAENHFRE